MEPFKRTEDGLPVRKDGFLHEEQYVQDLRDAIKSRLCPLAGYLTEEGVSIPQCERGVAPCPRTEVCHDYRAGCMNRLAFNRECGKMPYKACPRNICPILMRDIQVERNAKRLKGTS